MRDFKRGDILWAMNPRADMGNFYHSTVIGWEIRFQGKESEIFWRTKSHGLVSEHLAGHTREEAIKLWRKKFVIFTQEVSNGAYESYHVMDVFAAENWNWNNDTYLKG